MLGRLVGVSQQPVLRLSPGGFWASSKTGSAFCAGRRKVHYLFPDGKEMAEEYDEMTSELLGK